MRSAVTFPQKSEIRGRWTAIFENFSLNFLFVYFFIKFFLHWFILIAQIVQIGVRSGFVGVCSDKLKFMTLRDEIWPV